MSGPTILVADDDASVRLVISQTLAQEGYHVTGDQHDVGPVALDPGGRGRSADHRRLHAGRVDLRSAAANPPDTARTSDHRHLGTVDGA